MSQVTMSQVTMSQVIRVSCRSERDTERLAEDLATILVPGDLLALHGDLGVGKSTLARAIIRALADQPDLDVPSPTFTLVQDYDLERCPISHFDLYRLSHPDELEEIGFFDAILHTAVLVEWPSRADDDLPVNRLDVTLEVTGRETRDLVFSGDARWQERLERTLGIRAFLERTGKPDATRKAIQSDASTRAYERISTRDAPSILLMNAPAKQNEPILRDGLPYSRIACLAQDVRPFLAIGEALKVAGFSAPEIYAAAPDDGLLLIEDLGAEGVVHNQEPMEERYQVAIEVLAAMHNSPWPAVVQSRYGFDHTVPVYGLEAMMIEVELLLDWYVPYTRGTRLSGEAETAFRQLWRTLLDENPCTDPVWCLRDFHSPNLIWLPDRAGIERMGLIDFQDAVCGPAAYDVASLTRDARLMIPDALDNALVAQYCRLRMEADPSFDKDVFIRSHALMSAQRNTKILGIFARLHMRDGKPGYMQHLPHIRDYLRRSFTHPVLASILGWFQDHLSDDEVMW